jgi:serine/threonine protein kinase
VSETGYGRAIIKLLDFGLAKLRALDADSGSPTTPGGLTTPGMVMGTFGYMSPEQSHGEEVDERAGIFAVGVMVSARIFACASRGEGTTRGPRDRVLATATLTGRRAATRLGHLKQCQWLPLA